MNASIFYYQYITIDTLQDGETESDIKLDKSLATLKFFNLTKKLRIEEDAPE